MARALLELKLMRQRPCQQPSTEQRLAEIAKLQSASLTPEQSMDHQTRRAKAVGVRLWWQSNLDRSGVVGHLRAAGLPSARLHHLLNIAQVDRVVYSPNTVWYSVKSSSSKRNQHVQCYNRWESANALQDLIYLSVR